MLFILPWIRNQTKHSFESIDFNLPSVWSSFVLTTNPVVRVAQAYLFMYLLTYPQTNTVQPRQQKANPMVHLRNHHWSHQNLPQRYLWNNHCDCRVADNRHFRSRHHHWVRKSLYSHQNFHREVLQLLIRTQFRKQYDYPMRANDLWKHLSLHAEDRKLNGVQFMHNLHKFNRNELSR